MANDADRSLAQVPVISRLDENVVSKIAAGEVIQVSLRLDTSVYANS